MEDCNHKKEKWVSQNLKAKGTLWTGIDAQPCSFLYLKPTLRKNLHSGTSFEKATIYTSSYIPQTLTTLTST